MKTVQALLMHGRDYSCGIDNPTGWWVSEKFDGIRALWNGSNFISKNGNSY
jgi:DNA ligase-1